MKKKNIGLIITTIIIIGVVVATASVAIFAGAVALFGYTEDTETGTQQVQGNESEGGAENLGGAESGSQGGNQGGNQGGSSESTTAESVREEAEFGGAVTGAEMPEPDVELE